ncbi:hypothetical protein F5Y15DRAFT_412210 [Xylariaceae sp. FL0016]|nr:hypothetical protein F5Y15DRAFT_412210 [Xylariaceae sp. FL0016]
MSPTDSYHVHPELRLLFMDMRLACEAVNDMTKFSRRVSTAILLQMIMIIHHRILSLPPLKTLAKQLCQALKQPVLTQSQDPKVILWAAMIGAMAAANSELEDFFRGCIAFLSKTTETYHWLSAKAIMQDIVWCEQACDKGAQLIWSRSLGQGEAVTAGVEPN